MAIDVSVGERFSPADLFGAIEFAFLDASITSFSPTEISGSGLYNGQVAEFRIDGSGFEMGRIDGEAYVTSGIVDVIAFMQEEEGIYFRRVDIDMSEFAPVVHADDTGADPSAIEEFLMSLDWIISFTGSGDDIAGSDSTVGDGVPFNLTGDDAIYTEHGRDVFFCGGGADLIIGGLGRDRLSGGGGDDRLYGSRGNDKLYGSFGADLLDGGRDNDKLFGGPGGDTLAGGKNDDELFGGKGSDTFVFADKGGVDIILDFNADRNREKIDLSDVTLITTYRDLVENHMEQVGNDVVIDDHASTLFTRITLLDVDVNDLGWGDFLF